jgi:hypothetical protein
MMIPIEDLDWYYNQSDADLGFSAQSFDGMPQSDRDFHPSQQAMDAAARQKVVRHALQELAPNLQSAIEAAYSPGPLATQLKLKYGLLAGIIARRWPPKNAKELSLTVATAKKILATAHHAFTIAHKPKKSKSPWLSNLEKSADPYFYRS